MGILLVFDTTDERSFQSECQEIMAFGLWHRIVLYRASANLHSNVSPALLLYRHPYLALQH